MDAELARWKAAGQSFDYLGFDVFYRHEGQGPALLLVHGYPFNSFDWSAIWPTLTERFTVIAPDMMGMGFSAKPVAYRYSVYDHADMHEALLSHLGVRSAHVLAHDLGDSVAQEFLARNEFGEQSYGAWNIESITWLNGGLFNEAYTPRAMQKLMSATPLGDLMSPLQGSVLSRRLLEPTINEMFGPNTKPSRQLMDTFHQILEWGDGKRVLHKVGRFLDDRYTHRNRWVRAMRKTSVSLRLIDGPVDPNSGAHMARRYAEVVPDADVVMLADDIGHWPQIEAPEAVLTHFLAHIDRVTGQR
ncbi:putative hydrolase or acyltransferase of alpha/beta superfamily [Mycolicibacterium chubuense NBB4]|uniref:Putative hydrolase or acyltransferase of alpha/beta superfamily n=1 Tax=Mycolicibacterium chubuense (strain NBB4) TaxID=710421 RepID=I4BI53_MYCCN|nr:alpha/beta hydrolase [Mycolicibacterium chubuense]AFM16960.1 putative hydrolase or acyltransferase of alpha/beta superfamily [Mycolicibacterium chubuense NBB4]